MAIDQAAARPDLWWDGVVELAERWPLDAADGVRDAVLAAYGDEARGYHDLRHLTEVLDRLDELTSVGERFEPLPVRLAAWFHDSVYDGRPGAEERSAQWARDALAGLVEQAVVDEVARLVLATSDHLVSSGDLNGAALCDADLAILAGAPDRYQAYTADVRREYAHLTDDEFAAGRREVLRSLSGRPSLFVTNHGRQRWEPRARANLERELAELA